MSEPLDESIADIQPSVEFSPSKSNSTRYQALPYASPSRQVIGNGHKRPFSMSEDVSIRGDNQYREYIEEPKADIGALLEDEAPFLNRDDSLQLDPIESFDAEDEDNQVLWDGGTRKEISKTELTGARGRPKKISLQHDTLQQVPEAFEHELAGEPSPVEISPPVSYNISDSVEPEAPRRPAKKSKQEVYRDSDQEVDEGPSKPTKRRKITATKQKSSNTKRPPPPSERDPNAAIVSKRNEKGKEKGKGKGKEKEVMREKEKSVSREAPVSRPKPRSLVMLRSETPSDAAQFTRSGRTSVKPVAFWRNERVVYSSAKQDGKRLSLPGIKEVIRTEEVEDPRPRAGKKRGRPKKRVEETIEEADEDAEPWEEDPGVLQADVMQWDPLTERSMEDNMEQIGWCCPTSAGRARSVTH